MMSDRRVLIDDTGSMARIVDGLHDVVAALGALALPKDRGSVAGCSGAVVRGRVEDVRPALGDAPRRTYGFSCGSPIRRVLLAGHGRAHEAASCSMNASRRDAPTGVETGWGQDPCAVG